MSKGLVIILLVIALLVGGVGGFFGGRYYNDNKNKVESATDGEQCEVELVE